MSAPQTERPIIDVKTAARQLGVSVGMIYKLIRQRQLAGYEVGRKKIIYADAVAAYRQRRAITVAPPPAPPTDPIPPQRRRRQSAPPPLELPQRRHLT